MTRLLFHVVLDGDRKEKEMNKNQISREKIPSDRKQTEFTDYSLLLMTSGEVISTYSCVIRHFRSNTDILYSQTWNYLHPVRHLNQPKKKSTYLKTIELVLVDVTKTLKLRKLWDTDREPCADKCPAKLPV